MLKVVTFARWFTHYDTWGCGGVHVSAWGVIGHSADPK